MALLTWSSCHRVVRACCRCALLAAALFAGGGPVAAAPVATTQEYKVKAVFLFNFAQFVDWPPEAFATPQSPFIIGVLGDDPFDGTLDDVVRGETAHARPFVVRRYHRIEDIDVCHVLFISQTETARFEGIMAGLQGRSILTVGDSEGFAKAGGIIRFINERNRIRLRINVEAAKAANLRLSSKLLRPAEIVGAEKGTP